MEFLAVALAIWFVVGIWSAVALARWHEAQNQHIWSFHDTLMVVLAVIAGPLTFELICFMPDIRPYLLQRVARYR
ncbi:hypothetical protein LCGC14_2133540 [marine sediment metagenome]|uniref:Uncharacterized protein n=1 Tax=marine sediment metagenome TaxID=412755 RepID=A0A0F9GDN5_9ZZZZ